MKQISLALGGGGSKGNAHIGVLNVLEREGFRIGAIAGTSAGGLVGALYAYGYTPDEIIHRYSQIDFENLYKRLPDDSPAWLGLEGLHEALNDLLGDCMFSDLRIPFAVTAVNLQTAEIVVLQSGKVVDALLATVAVPGLFPPKILDNQMLVDGAVLASVPVAQVRALNPRLPVAAVVLSPLPGEWRRGSSPRLLKSLPMIARYVSRLRIAQAMDIFMRAVDIGGAYMAELRLQIDKPEVIIRPDVMHIGLLDQVDIYQVAKLGELAAESMLPAIRKVTSWPSNAVRYIKYSLKS